MSSGIERVFVGWERPMLHSLVELIRAREAARLGAVEDFSRVTVVLPGARAGRRLLELLTLSAGARAVVPPRILTLGAWVHLGTRASGAPAGTMARLAAWVGAFGSLDGDARGAIARIRLQGESGGLGWLGVARMIDATHTELCGEGLRFSDVSLRGGEAEYFADADRWNALATAQRMYESLLRDAGLVDAGLASLDTLEPERMNRDALTGGGRVVLAGISEMNKVARGRVAAVAGHCTALVPAPAELADWFDEYGCVLPGSWESAQIDVPAEAVIGVDGPDEQAGTALRIVARFTQGARGSGVPADQVTIGVPDTEVEERLRRLSGRLGHPVRRAGGTPVSFTRPVKLLLAVADYVEHRDFAALAALVRHPDIERWIAGTRRARAAGGRVKPERWLALLDAYHSRHLHARVDGSWLTDNPAELSTLSLLQDAAGELLSGAGASLLDDARREPAHWCRPVWDVLRTIYSQRGAPGTGPDGSDSPRPDPATHEACFIIQAHLLELAALPSGLADGLRLTPGETIRFVLQQAVGDAIPDPGETAAIDLVGWLELAADDAPWMIVTGMNEGAVPAAAGIDPLLPEGLRRALGLRDRRERFARDALAVQAMIHARPAGRTVFVFGRRSAAGDPLSPSRLLLMGDRASLLARVRQWTGAQRSVLETGTLMVRHGAVSAFDIPPTILPGVGEIDEMSVTSFRQYLESPYAFYLRHVLRLEEVDDRAVELDARGFGTLIHDVLLTLVDGEIAACADPERISAFLVSQLEAVANVRFGPDPRAEVWVQLEQARARLRAFARVQAERARAGWRVARTEWSPGKRTASLIVDGKPMYLRGRIDRVDIRPDTGEWAVLDYKTGSSKPDMNAACTRKGVWRDPQLALYRHLARDLAPELGVSGEPRLAWIALPTVTDDTAFVHAEWTREQLQAADEAVAGVVRRVRRAEFSVLGPCPPGDGIVGALCGGLEHEEGEA